ncbi:MAG: M42 family metallopeptidase, partial [Firmicutes bacterium]|nr:M42 family metallopeptidase [Bacillota bacterium]
MRFEQVAEAGLDETVELALSHILSLVSIPSPTGYAYRAVDYCYRVVAELGYQLSRTHKGGLVIHVPGRSERTRVLAAHVDTLGAMVKEILPSGRLRVARIGGFPCDVMEGEYCKVHTLEGAMYTGTIVAHKASTHVYREVEERREDTMEVRLDELVHSAGDVGKLLIRVGDFVSFDVRAVLTPSGYLKSRHLDDKASVGILLTLLKILKDEQMMLPYSLTLLISTDEEIGYGGNSNIPDQTFEYVAVDMGAIGDGLTTTEHVVSICAKDSSGPYDFELRKKLTYLAERYHVPHAVDLYPNYASD